MPKYNNLRKTWRYPDEFKSKAVQLTLLRDIRVKEVAKILDIHPFMLSRWRKEYREGKIKIDKRVKVSSMAKDKKEINLIKKLEKENLHLKLETYEKQTPQQNSPNCLNARRSSKISGLLAHGYTQL